MTRSPATIASRAVAIRRRRRDVGGTGAKARASLSAAEVGGALLDEGHDAFDEVVGLGHLPLDLRLELQLVRKTPVDPVVQLALGTRERLGRALGQAVEQL